jgi:hypothetical protein
MPLKGPLFRWHGRSGLSANRRLAGRAGDLDRPPLAPPEIPRTTEDNGDPSDQQAPRKTLGSLGELQLLHCIIIAARPTSQRVQPAESCPRCRHRLTCSRNQLPEPRRVEVLIRPLPALLRLASRRMIIGRWKSICPRSTKSETAAPLVVTQGASAPMFP